VLQVDADARPRAEAAAHGIDQYVRGLKMRGGIWMARLPSLDAGQGARFFSRTPNFNQWKFRRPPL